ncbi:hypothetical protein PE143B_0125085 [Pseudomonas extremaustralis 14-3 substr. 14-3b]|uniref:Uncharacterized protein n=1 Tax=Pseudomonas extremaustralis TaxID=359110 RepID=A0A5C5Q6R1_9PSED|nr:hypothetical protein PE143B_0125085 [Pseudomonas extremaustralis 14-3 substr. 14-3b]TWS01447.1 hypothetical protein FIV36_24615 [Pseudomonas extremaustralis]
MLAKAVNDNAAFLDKRGVLGFFASKLAPTEDGAVAVGACLRGSLTMTRQARINAAASGFSRRG